MKTLICTVGSEIIGSDQREELSEVGVLWWPSDSNNYNGDREDTSSPRPLWSLRFFSLLCSLFFAYFKACTRRTVCVRMINIQDFISGSFFLPNPIVSECVSECEKPTKSVLFLSRRCSFLLTSIPVNGKK